MNNIAPQSPVMRRLTQQDNPAIARVIRQVSAEYGLTADKGYTVADLIDAQVEQLMTLAEKFDVEYDGWGTYFEDPNGEDGDDEDFVDEDDDGVRH